jgi:hypothetical protein
MAALRKLSILCLFAFALPAAAVDEMTCNQHRDQLLTLLRTDRNSTLEKIEHAIAKLNDGADKALLEYQREGVWDREEELRATAGHTWYDCMQHVRSSK